MDRNGESCNRVRRLGGVCSPVTATAVDVEELKREATSVTDPAALWERYVEWLYHNEDLALSLDVSRISFSPHFVEAMEPKVRQKTLPWHPLHPSSSPASQLGAVCGGVSGHA